VIEGYYRIGLGAHGRALVDFHFLGAGGHLLGWQLATTEAHRHFHRTRFLAHTVRMYEAVQFGDFSPDTFDNTGRGFDRPEAWSPRALIDASRRRTWDELKQYLPDEQMWVDFGDPAFFDLEVGASLCFDALLRDSSLEAVARISALFNGQAA
jgi:hypothetical protein